MSVVSGSIYYYSQSGVFFILISSMSSQSAWYLMTSDDSFPRPLSVSADFAESRGRSQLCTACGRVAGVATAAITVRRCDDDLAGALM